MKVLKPGRAQSGWSIETTCTGNGNGGGGCGAKLLVEQPDLFKTESWARDEKTTYVTFRCSACSVLTDLPDRSVPSSVTATLPSKRAWEERYRNSTLRIETGKLP